MVAAINRDELQTLAHNGVQVVEVLGAQDDVSPSMMRVSSAVGRVASLQPCPRPVSGTKVWPDVLRA